MSVVRFRLRAPDIQKGPCSHQSRGLFVCLAIRRLDDEPPPGSTKCTAFGDERAARSPQGRNSPKAVPINPPPEWKARSPERRLFAPGTRSPDKQPPPDSPKRTAFGDKRAALATPRTPKPQNRHPPTPLPASPIAKKQALTPTPGPIRPDLPFPAPPDNDLSFSGSAKLFVMEPKRHSLSIA